MDSLFDDPGVSVLVNFSVLYYLPKVKGLEPVSSIFLFLQLKVVDLPVHEGEQELVVVDGGGVGGGMPACAGGRVRTAQGCGTPPYWAAPPRRDCVLVCSRHSERDLNLV